MAKRFPIPEFDYAALRGLAATAPPVIDVAEAARLARAAGDGDGGVAGARVVQATDPLFEGLGVRGEHRCAVLCLLPPGPVTMTGRSHAWKLQRLVAAQGTPADAGAAMVEWKTPRPMNTRLGPEDGVPAPGPVLTLICGHRYDDHWVGNRCIVDDGWRPATGSGFRVAWSDDPQGNDFHAAVVSFTWDT